MGGLPPTINAEKLARFRLYTLPCSYSVGPMGRGCDGDPPGYPSYYAQSVYTMHGNPPARGPRALLFGRIIEHSDDWNAGTYDEVSEKLAKRLWLLWRPLPLDHPRTETWIRNTYAHLQHCYHDPDAANHTVIYPVTEFWLPMFHDDPRFSDEWREKEKARIAQARAKIIAHAEKLATPENHRATRLIRKFYPEFQPRTDLIENPPKSGRGGVGTWWERHEEKPTPETCQGESWAKHPVNKTWCQVCGWYAEDAQSEK